MQDSNTKTTALSGPTLQFYNSPLLGFHPQPKPSYQTLINSKDSVCNTHTHLYNIYVHVCVCVLCVYIYVCTYIYRHTHILLHAKMVVITASSYKTLPTHQTL